MNISAQKTVQARFEKQDFVLASYSCGKSSYEDQIEAHIKDLNIPSKAGKLSKLNGSLDICICSLSP